MSNSFALRDGQTVTIDFAQEPTLVDFAKLIALLELQRSFLDGSPGPVVVVEFRSPPPPQPQSFIGRAHEIIGATEPNDRLVPRMNGADDGASPFFAGQSGIRSVAEGTVSNFEKSKHPQFVVQDDPPCPEYCDCADCRADKLDALANFNDGNTH